MNAIKNFVIGTVNFLFKAAQDRADAKNKQIIRGS